MPTIIWKCETCQKQLEGAMRPPENWNELSFWNGERFIRYSFCSYKCASLWAGNRYDKPKEAKMK